MTSERFTMRVAVFLILIRDGKVWLQRRANTGYRDGHYDLPSGHVDAGESVIQAAARELREETAITATTADLTGVHVLNNNDGVPYIDVFFRVQNWEGEPSINEPEKCDDAGWFPLSNLPTPMAPHVEQGLSHISNNVVYSDLGWNS